MDMTKPTPQELAQEFMRGRGCAQCVLGRYGQALGYDQEETDRMAVCFSGGMFMGNTCGAVTGGLIAIGLAVPAEQAKAKAIAFQNAFRGKCGSCACKELLGYDLSVPEQAAAARESGKLLTYCPTPVLEAMGILDHILADYL